jgi:hypothetical protein
MVEFHFRVTGIPTLVAVSVGDANVGAEGAVLPVIEFSGLLLSFLQEFKMNILNNKRIRIFFIFLP